MVGNKYEETKNLSGAEVAKLIRKDLKAAFPGIKFSVRTTGSTTHESIDIEVKTLPAGLNLYVPSLLDTVRYSDEAQAFIRSVDAVREAYNFDHSEIETDYFNVRFYGSVSFSSEVRAAAKPAPEQELPPQKVVELALGRIFRMGSRPFQQGDIEEFDRCKALIMNALERTA